MQKRSRSISYRLQKTSNSAKRVEILTEWANQWKFEHIDLIERLKGGIDNQDMNEIRIALGQLRAVTEKKHEALHHIFRFLLDDRNDKK